MKKLLKDPELKHLVVCISPPLPFPNMYTPPTPPIPPSHPSHPFLPPPPPPPPPIPHFLCHPSSPFVFFYIYLFDRLEGKINNRNSYTHVPLQNRRNYGCIPYSSFSSFLFNIFFHFSHLFYFFIFFCFLF